MSIATMIERIVGKQRERQAARTADFRAIVAEIADGNEPDTDIVAQVLRDTDKSLDDLQQAVELLQQRRDLRQKLDSVSRLMSKRRELEKQVAAADRDLEAAEKRHSEVVIPLQADLDDLKQQIWTGEQARAELWRTCSYPELRTRLSDVETQKSKASKASSKLKGLADDLREGAERDRQEVKHLKRILGAEHRIGEYVDSAKQRDTKAAEYEAELAKTEKTIAALDREEAAIREQMLVP